MLTRLSGTSVPSVQSKVMPPSSRQKSFTVYSEQGGSRFVWNVGTFPQNYVTPGYGRRLYAPNIKAEIIHTSTPNKEAAGSSETSAHFHKIMWHQDTEDVFMPPSSRQKLFTRLLRTRRQQVRLKRRYISTKLCDTRIQKTSLCLHHQGRNYSHVYSEQGGSRFVWNVGTFPQNYVTSRYRRRFHELLSELEVFYVPHSQKGGGVGREQ